MGLNNNVSGKVTYLNIIDGKLTVRLSEDDYNVLKERGEAVRKRKKKDGSDAYERIFDSLTATLINYEDKFNEQFKSKEVILTFEDGGELFKIQFPYGSRIHSMFLERSPNINPVLPLTFGVFLGTKQDGSQVTMMYLKQEASGSKETLKPAFPKDGSGALPPLKKIKVKGVEQYSNDDQLEFHEANTVPSLKSKLISGQPVGQNVGEPQMAEASDDLPF
jgi:hypothetical protein